MIRPNVNSATIPIGSSIGHRSKSNPIETVMLPRSWLRNADERSVPPNCRFEIDDAEEEWIFGQKFDYIHGRALATCFTDPSTVINSAYNSLAPGGWLELQDGTFPFQYIGEPPKESHMYKWNEIIIQGGEKARRPWTNVQHYKRWMEEAGLKNIMQKTFYWPINPWAKGQYYKQIGHLFRDNLLNGLEGISMKVMGMAGWQPEEIQVFLVGLRKEIEDSDMHAYLPM
jgi:hypothetical protein